MATRILECAAPSGTSLGLQIVPRILLEKATMTATAIAVSSQPIVSLACRLVCVQSDEQIYVRVGQGINATPASYRIPAGSEQYFEAGLDDVISIRT
mgnify:CR=1 FL=1